MNKKGEFSLLALMLIILFGSVFIVLMFYSMNQSKELRDMKLDACKQLGYNYHEEIGSKIALKNICGNNETSQEVFFKCSKIKCVAIPIE